MVEVEEAPRDEHSRLAIKPACRSRSRLGQYYGREPLQSITISWRNEWPGPAQNPPPDAADALAFLLSQVGAHSSARFADRLEPLGLKPPHAGILRVIQEADGLSQQALGDRLGMFPSRLVGVLDELGRLGLVERRDNPVDRRSYALYLTEAGRGSRSRSSGSGGSTRTRSVPRSMNRSARSSRRSSRGSRPSRGSSPASTRAFAGMVVKKPDDRRPGHRREIPPGREARRHIAVRRVLCKVEAPSEPAPGRGPDDAVVERH